MPHGHINRFDPTFARRVSRLFTPLERYFRYQVHGLGNIPKQGAALLVMNHGVIPFHGFLLAKRLADVLSIYPRGLGAAFLFEIPGVREFFLKGGAVNADPRNAEALLAQGHIVMLAPGGIYEALIARRGMRRIPWERRFGFVKLALRTGTPIIPTYCQGINSAYLNSTFLLKPRIKLLERTRFSMPLFFGLGVLPFPVKLVHRIGKPIHPPKSQGKLPLRRHMMALHQRVVDAMIELATTR